MIRLDILTAISRYDLSHSEKPDVLYITETQWDQLMAGHLGEPTVFDPATKGERVYLGMEVEFIPHGDLRVSHYSNK